VANEAIESESPALPEPNPNPPTPITQEPTVFDRAVQAVNNQVGALNFQQQLDKEVLADKDKEIETLRGQVKQLEDTLAPFLAVEPPAEESNTSSSSIPKAEEQTVQPVPELGNPPGPDPAKTSTNGKSLSRTPAPN
jgi:hypothetical protein